MGTEDALVVIIAAAMVIMILDIHQQNSHPTCGVACTVLLEKTHHPCVVNKVLSIDS